VEWIYILGMGLPAFLQGISQHQYLMAYRVFDSLA
jgi:uncharacterized membrane protein